MEGVVLAPKPTQGKISVNLQSNLQYRVTSNIANTIRTSVFNQHGFTRF
jgi:hypothetical protein